MTTQRSTRKSKMTEDERRLIHQRDPELINAHLDELVAQPKDLDGHQAKLEFSISEEDLES
jgi:hypothetical protein